MARPKRIRSEESESQSKFVNVLESFLVKAEWTNQQFMAAMQVGESQFYRWARGNNVPTKALVNRSASILASRLDKVKGILKEDPFPYSDKIDFITNELLESAGYSSTVRGREVNLTWNKIAQEQVWKLGYTEIPKWIKAPDRIGDEPTGVVVEYVKEVSSFLGVKTIWKYLNWEDMPCAIVQGEVDAIAPFLIILPERFFDYRFSNPCSENFNTLSGLYSPSGDIETFDSLEDISPEKVQLVSVHNELGNWAAKLYERREKYKSDHFGDADTAISYLLANSDVKSSFIPVFLSDKLTCEAIREEHNSKSDPTPLKCLELLNAKKFEKIEFYTAFAFHPDEDKLATAVNSAISLAQPFKPY